MGKYWWKFMRPKANVFFVNGCWNWIEYEESWWVCLNSCIVFWAEEVYTKVLLRIFDGRVCDELKNSIKLSHFGGLYFGLLKSYSRKSFQGEINWIGLSQYEWFMEDVAKEWWKTLKFSVDFSSGPSKTLKKVLKLFMKPINLSESIENT